MLAQVRVLIEPVFVELGRRDGGTGEHAVDLATVVNLVLVKVAQDVFSTLDANDAAVTNEANGGVKGVFGEALAEVDEANVAFALSGAEVGEGVEGLFALEAGEAPPGAEKSVDVIPVHNEDMAQGGEDGLEEGDSLGAEIGLREGGARGVETMVRPGIIAG